MKDSNRPASELNKEERHRIATEAIALWVGNRRLDQAMAREEIAQLEGIQRHLALSKSLIGNVIRVCRREKRADTRLAVLVLITLLCDNNGGVCVLGIKRMAQLLDRTENNVRDAIKSLEQGGEISVNRTTGGMLNSYWPNVPAAVATMNPAVAWFVDALSDKPNRNRPVLAVQNDHPPPAAGGVPPTPPGAGGYPPAGGVQYISTSSTKASKTRQAQGEVADSFSDLPGTTSQQPTHGATSAGRPPCSPDNGGAALPTGPQQLPTASRSSLDGASTAGCPSSPVAVSPDNGGAGDTPPPVTSAETTSSNQESWIAQFTDQYIQQAEEYLHYPGGGRAPVKPSEMDPGWLLKAIRIEVRTFNDMSPETRLTRDIVPSLRSKLLAARSHPGLKLPKDTPTLETLEALLPASLATPKGPSRRKPRVVGREQVKGERPYRTLGPFGYSEPTSVTVTLDVPWAQIDQETDCPFILDKGELCLVDSPAGRAFYHNRLTYEDGVARRAMIKLAPGAEDAMCTPGKLESLVLRECEYIRDQDGRDDRARSAQEARGSNLHLVAR